MTTLLVCAGIAHLFVGPAASLPAALILVYMGYVYWERRPPLPSEPKTLVSPVRGRVIDVTQDRDPWLDRDVLRIRIRVRFPGIVPLRGPIEGKVMEFYTASGVLGESQRACAANESPDCYVSWLRTDEGEDIVYAVSSSWPVSRARFNHSPGERVGHGKRSGFVYFASVVDVLVPVNALPRTEPGEYKVAGAGFLAQLPRA